MITFINRLKADFPNISFEKGAGFYWSPNSRSVVYRDLPITEKIKCTLLHEVAHGELDHKAYTTDIELLRLEVAAWDKALQFAKNYKVTISSDHIQNCLDSYRNWLHHRSACPSCDNHTIQIDSGHYRCFNCHAVWKVSAARFCRPYRKIEIQKRTLPEDQPQVMFL